MSHLIFGECLREPLVRLFEKRVDTQAYAVKFSDEHSALGVVMEERMRDAHLERKKCDYVRIISARIARHYEQEGKELSARSLAKWLEISRGRAQKVLDYDPNGIDLDLMVRLCIKLGYNHVEHALFGSEDDVGITVEELTELNNCFLRAGLDKGKGTTQCTKFRAQDKEERENGQ